MVGSGSAAYGQGWEMDAIAACVVGGISFTGGIQPLMVNALTDEGPSGIDYRERGPMWRWSRPERKAKLSISINHHHTEPAQNADVGCMPGLLLPAVPALPWWLSTVARMWKTRMALPWRAFPTQRAPPSGLTLLWDRLPSW